MGSSGFGLIPERSSDPAFTFSEKNECVLESVCCVVKKKKKSEWNIKKRNAYEGNVNPEEPV